MSKADKTKEYIIERTASIFNTKGYAGTSLNDMTEVTGLTKGSIYGNFKNKDDVAVEAFKYNFGVMSSLFSSEMAKKKTCREKLLVYPYLLGNFSETRFPEGGCPVLNTAVESDDTHPLLRQQTILAFTKWKNGIINLLKDGIAANEFHPDIHLEQVSLTMLAMLEGGIMIRKLTNNQKYIDNIISSLQDYINSL
ncbi:transcriptional regulator [Prevotella herbatica]|uniref:Transcriptional regulator n=1 Tax=Prevotella herbatica TaxID=2801997 RepID=A0ABM7P1P3_9BACT|nr:TetR/AcrR family transcriptional regulator [Prevotella herbatica]BCS86681.1 transcriptional regulator [Prevotella herbatica]